MPVQVPGSVQQALLDAGVLPDWNMGMAYRQCEWVENRHWVYETTLPDDWLKDGATVRLRCLGLDGNGLILLNDKVVATFDNAFIPYGVDLTPHLNASDNRLHLVFECPPRWLGQFGYTSRMTDWKPRFNYYWDWTARLVQIGAWDQIQLEIIDDAELQEVSLTTDVDLDRGLGKLRLTGRVAPTGTALQAGASVTLSLHDKDGDREIQAETMAVDPEDPSLEVVWQDLDIELWWPNGHGDQPLYAATLSLHNAAGTEIDTATRTVGFKHVTWQPCEGAPADADPWICEINGKPIFLQGFNWTPIRPNFADVEESDYAQRLVLYRDLKVNALRVWGGAYLEKSIFYDLCDALGILVWQEFPLSSSGHDNYAPDDPQSIAALTAVARSYIRRRHHHVSLLMWSGGNELQNDKDGKRGPDAGPLGLDHPLLQAFHDIVQEMDPVHRFVPTSASGPKFFASPENFGKDVHWDVHGPWSLAGIGDTDWAVYWAGDDALFRSETGCPGPSSAEVIRRYAGDLPTTPGTYENPLWRRTSWWIEWQDYVDEIGTEPANLEAYVAWGQQRQAQALHTAAQACKDRFPQCGGFLVWMGHDSFPCTANTSVVDFEGHPKPAAFALADVFGAESETIA